jgi:hypothetical protein
MKDEMEQARGKRWGEWKKDVFRGNEPIEFVHNKGLNFLERRKRTDF